HKEHLSNFENQVPLNGGRIHCVAETLDAWSLLSLPNSVHNLIFLSLYENFLFFLVGGCILDAAAAYRSRMLRPMLACCKLYVSEGRSSAVLRAVEQAARRHHPAVALVNTFADDAYNRVGYTLVSRLPHPVAPATPLRRAVFGMVEAALGAI
uniref:Formiminotransferase N-terminal subdomain domain-containing protein n=1 Tax=Aegilops tauschii subsp. strangulata TaxID=200361 RepID=A0A453QH82_AEGTS